MSRRQLDALGLVRLSHLTRRDSVTRRGDQITAWTDEALIARVREERAHRDQYEMLCTQPRVTLVDRLGTVTW